MKLLVHENGDLNITPLDIEKAMIKWLVRFRDRGQFSLEKPNEKS